MALKITDDCISCDACLGECPNDAISPGEDIYVIDPQRCTECVGVHDSPACASTCPTEACVADRTAESEGCADRGAGRSGTL
jgi:ferredoxin